MKFRNIITWGAIMMCVPVAIADNLVIMHTNDTHSQIEPNDKNLGGILRRKVLIDSIRQAVPNSILVDCGDAVQGTLYYTLYKGEVERKMMNELGYEIAILGNHEFDNGMDILANELSKLNAEKLTSNYDVRNTPLNGLFKPYTIKQVGNRKIGFIAINLNPKGMIADNNVEGLKYLDGITAANSLAWYLKNVEHVDQVIALTHVGYTSEDDTTPGDCDIAAGSENIDIIIGGHSHTTIDPTNPKSPAYKHVNAVGDTIIVAQTGSRGVNLGQITINLDNFDADYKLIPVTSRLDNRIDQNAAKILSPYKHGVDSLRNVKIGNLAQELPAGSQILLNWVADVMCAMGNEVAGRTVDLAIVNKGGIRRGLPSGAITKEMIMTMLPFDNHIEILEIKGSDLKAAFEVMAKRGGDGVSGGFDIAKIDDNRTYTLATIDYLANGGDYMTPLTQGKVTARSKDRLDETMMQYIERQNNRKIKYTDSKPRM